MKSKLGKFVTTVFFMCVCSISLAGCTGQKGTITYEFTGNDADKAGYAEGTITFKAKEAGTYDLYWSNDVGALDGYYEIASLQITEENAKAEFVFEYHTAIPADATKIIAIETGDDVTEADAIVEKAIAVYDIPQEKQLNYQSADALYTFNSYSDIHFH